MRLLGFIPAVKEIAVNKKNKPPDRKGDKHSGFYSQGGADRAIH